jgi:transposase InsO family protein
VRKRKKVRRPPAERTPLNIATKVNEVWRADFVSDSLVNGRRLKCLTVADDFGREAVDIAVDYGISGQYVIRLLDQTARFRGYPCAVQSPSTKTPAEALVWRKGAGQVFRPSRASHSLRVAMEYGMRIDCVQHHDCSQSKFKTAC